jgi:hypothetical protein
MAEQDFFTIDRLGTLKAGSSCELVRYSDVSPKVLLEHVEEMFPDGLSSHGESYFLRNSANALHINPMLELVFEQVRRASFPQRPSRFQSTFAVDSLDAAHALRGRMKTPTARIFRVSSKQVAKADMNLLHSGSILVTSYLAHRYWSGEPHPERPAFWEYLLRCPVVVKEQVE